jgi:glutamine amidotransferase
MINKIIVIDYGVGNILSIKNAISYHGFTPLITNKKKDIQNASHIILPGVGAFPQAMKKLKDLDLVNPIIEAANKKTYLLGICLGMQLLFTSSEEFENTNGLNLMKGNIKKLDKFNSFSNFKLPNIGWRNCNINLKKNKISILKNLSSENKFYFVHSYGLHNYDDNLNLVNSNYKNLEIPAVVNQKNIFGCQFHPEKSGSQGLKIIKNFLEL